MILLILAGITLNLVIGENGIIAKAKESKEKYGQDAENTDMALESLYDEMLGYLDEETIETNNNGKATYPIEGVGKFGTTGTIDGGAASASNPTIPAQYTPVNTRDAKWDAEGGPEYNKGLVIVDDNGNEWVWVPVDSTTLAGMYETSDTALPLSGSPSIAPVSGCGTSSAILSEDVTTTKYSKTIIGEKTRGTPGSRSYREPDLVAGYDNASGAQTAGFSSLADMATKLVSDYETMIASIEIYHGFYIGRYELTANGEKAGATLTNKNWYKLYANCKNLAVGDQAITRMIWGCQWDVTCNWLGSMKDENGNTKYNISDSRSWGNYSNSTGNAAVTMVSSTGSGSGTGTVNAYGRKKETGYSDFWKANNIYDFAGNCYEWTQEAFDTFSRAIRGGVYDYSGSDNPASFRGSAYDPTSFINSNLRFSLHFNN